MKCLEAGQWHEGAAQNQTCGENANSGNTRPPSKLALAYTPQSNPQITETPARPKHTRKNSHTYRIQLVLVRGHLRSQLGAQRFGRGGDLGVDELVVQSGRDERKHAL